MRKFLTSATGILDNGGSRSFIVSVVNSGSGGVAEGSIGRAGSSDVGSSRASSSVGNVGVSVVGASNGIVGAGG